MSEKLVPLKKGERFTPKNEPDVEVVIESDPRPLTKMQDYRWRLLGFGGWVHAMVPAGRLKKWRDGGP